MSRAEFHDLSRRRAPCAHTRTGRSRDRACRSSLFHAGLSGTPRQLLPATDQPSHYVRDVPWFGRTAARLDSVASAAVNACHVSVVASLSA